MLDEVVLDVRPVAWPDNLLVRQVSVREGHPFDDLTVAGGSHEDHLYVHRRSAGARYPLVAADRRRVRRKAGVPVETRDISLAARILAQFPERLGARPPCRTRWPSSASSPRRPRPTSSSCPTSAPRCPQLKAAIKELQQAGYDIPDYPESAVVGRRTRPTERRTTPSREAPSTRCCAQGNSDRRAPASVKNYARSHPHSMGDWSSSSKSHVSTMTDGDFRHSERSVTLSGSG